MDAIYTISSCIQLSGDAYLIYQSFTEEEVGDVQHDGSFQIKRLDLVTFDQFPVKEGVTNLSEAEQFADRETAVRSNRGGDIFFVIQGDEIVYVPDVH